MRAKRGIAAALVAAVSCVSILAACDGGGTGNPPDDGKATDFNPAVTVKELSREEYYRLVKEAEKRGRERLSLALQTLCGLGLRISELKAVTAGAVRSGKLRILNKGKGRTVYMGRTLQARLLAYMKRKKIKTGEVFTTRTGRGLNRSNLWREMKRLCEKSGVSWNKIFPHNLRHLFARTFYAAQKDVVRLADIMGHSNIETTRIYTASSGREYRKKIEELGLVL